MSLPLHDTNANGHEIPSTGIPTDSMLLLKDVGVDFQGSQCPQHELSAVPFFHCHSREL